MNMEGKMRRTYIRFVGLFGAIVLAQLILCAGLGFHRQYLFCDEVFSYGLANCDDYAFLQPDKNQEPIENWVSGEYFKNYLQYDRSGKFSFYAAFENQAQDVHPPFYYCLLHIICYFFQKSAYSPATGIILNLIILVGVDIALFYISDFFLKSRGKALLTVALWGFSAAGISNVMLIRMYLLQTFEILLFIAFHIYILKHKKKMTCIYWLLLALIVAMGGLTHYYFYFFVAAMGGLICLYCLVRKKIANMFAYGSALVFGLLLALGIFPATYDHIFGYRGSYATENIGKFTSDKMLTYLNWINKSLFAGTFKLFVAVIVLIAVWKFINKFFCQIICEIQFVNGKRILMLKMKRINISEFEYKKVIDERQILWLFCLIADVLFMYIAMEGSEITQLRYIYPAYPLLVMVVVKLLADFVCGDCKKQGWKRAICICISAVFCVGSIKAYGIDWLYTDYKNWEQGANELKGKDCIVICQDTGWVNIYEAIGLYQNMDECTYLLYSDLGRVQELLDSRKSDDPLVVTFPDEPSYTDEQINDMLNVIIANTTYTNYELKYDYYTKAYVLQ